MLEDGIVRLDLECSLESDASPDARRCLLKNVHSGAERSVVLQPVQERSHSLRQRSLQLRNVTLGFMYREKNQNINNIVLLYWDLREGNSHIYPGQTVWLREICMWFGMWGM